MYTCRAAGGGPGKKMFKFTGPGNADWGSIQKKWGIESIRLVSSLHQIGGVLKEAVTDADNYHLEFKPNATTEEKIIEIVTGIAVDYVFFEKEAGGALTAAGSIAKGIASGGASLAVDMASMAAEAGADLAAGAIEEAMEGFMDDAQEMVV